MKTEEQKENYIILIALNYISNILIGISLFKYLSKSSEFAATLIRYITMIKILFICIVISSLYLLIITKLNQYKIKYKVIISISLLIIFYFINYNINYSIIFPKPISKEKQISKRIKKIEENKEKALIRLKTADIYRPSDRIVKKDKSILINGIKKHLSINNFKGDSLKKIYDFFSADSTGFKSIYNSIDCPFIIYSPNHKFFIAIITFKRPFKHSDLDSFNGTKLMCKRNKDSLEIYSTCNNNNWNYYTKDAYLYETLSAQNFMGYCPELRNEKNEIIPDVFEKKFWNSSFYFKKINVNNQLLYRFQTEEVYEYDKKIYQYIEKTKLVIQIDTRL